MVVRPVRPGAGSRRLVALGTLAALTALTALGACSSESLSGREPPSSNETFASPATSFDLAEGLVIAPRALSDTVTLRDDLLLVPTGEGHDESRAFVAGLKNGWLLVGDRDHARPLAASGNPVGFVRRIVRVDEGRTEARITTTRAELDDVFVHGDLDWRTSPALLPGGPTDALAGPSEGAAPLAPSPGADPTCRRIRYTRPLELTSGAGVTLVLRPSLEVEACHDGHHRKRRRALARDVREALEVHVTGTLDVAVDAPPGGTGGSLHGTFSAPPVHVALPGPVPTTLVLVPLATCDAEARGPARATLRGEVRLDATAGFTFAGGAGITPAEATTSASATFAPTTDGSAVLTAACTLSFETSLVQFDAPRVVGRAAPSFALREALCLPNRGLSVTERAELELGGRVGVPELGRTVEGPLAEATSAPATRFVVGDAATCEGVTPETTCSGKADGWYCDPANRAAALRCDGGRYGGQKRCADGACVGDAQGRATLDARAELVCR